MATDLTPEQRVRDFLDAYHRRTGLDREEIHGLDGGLHVEGGTALLHADLTAILDALAAEKAAREEAERLRDVHEKAAKSYRDNWMQTMDRDDWHERAVGTEDAMAKIRQALSDLRWDIKRASTDVLMLADAPENKRIGTELMAASNHLYDLSRPRQEQPPMTDPTMTPELRAKARQHAEDALDDTGNPMWAQYLIWTLDALAEVEQERDEWETNYYALEAGITSPEAEEAFRAAWHTADARKSGPGTKVKAGLTAVAHLLGGS